MQSDIKLRPLEPLDIDFFWTEINTNRDNLKQWLPFIEIVDNYKEAVEYLDLLLELEEGEQYRNYSICLNDQWIGMITLKEIDWFTRKAELGYWLSPQWQNRGIATKALEKTLDICYSKLHLNRLQVRIAENNYNSIKLIRKFHFVFEGIERDGEICDKKYRDLKTYSLLKTEWMQTMSRSKV